MTLKQKHEMGSGGNCVCPKCDDMARPSTRCPFYERCPECAVKMVRGGSEHHLLIKERKRKG